MSQEQARVRQGMGLFKGFLKSKSKWIAEDCKRDVHCC